MAFFQLVLKANNLKRARRRYHDEKLRSIEISKGAKVHYTLGQRIRRQRILLKRKVRGCFRKLTSCPGHTWLHRIAVLLRTDGTLENYVLKSICGFLAGVLLTYMFFVFFVFQLHFGLASATVFCSVIGVVLTLGLAFSPKVRCIVFLFLPQFFSKRGRQALMAYAFILALSGPAKNTLQNVAVLSDSLACGQEQLKEAVKAIIDLVKQPFYALRDTLGKIVKSIKAIVKRIKKTLIAMKRLVISILRVIKSVFDWLGSIVNICNRDLGTPYDRCQGAFGAAVANCREHLGPFFGSVCSVTYVAGSVCYALKPLDLMCVLVSYVSDAIVGEVKRRLYKFSREMKAMFYVKIKFSHSFHMETNKSKSLKQISTGISSDIKKKTDRFLSLIDWVGFMTSFFFLFLLLRVIYYRYKWLTNDRFDNHYISGYMREIDIKRARQDKETIFPLNQRERNKYAAVTSVLLIRPEKVKLAKSAIFLAVTSVKLGIYMAIDYCLFWLLDTISSHGRTATKVQRPSYSGVVEVEGEGFLADTYRSVALAFTPDSHLTEVEAVSCLPVPKPPNYDSYLQILTLALFCWVMALFEPYGLRLRHVVLSNYYPDRAKQRAVWLYNNIIRSRGSFLKFARRQLRRQFGMARADGIERVTLRERFWSVCPLLNRLWPLNLNDACLVCGQPERDKSAPHVRCPTPSCPGVYCPQCFQDLGKLCTVCLSPMDYGDLTDMSEEKDSSDDQIDISRFKKIPLQSDMTEVKPEEIIAEKGGEVLEHEEPKKLSEVPTEQRDISDDDSSSKYSYSYQDEPAKDSVIPEKLRFKDVEAQEIRDDVTMQIFSEPLCEELLSSSSEGRIFCFGLARRKKSSKPKKKTIIVKQDGTESDSTSIADTESWATEEIEDKEEQVLEIEIEDFDDERYSDDELLPEACKKKTKHKRSRFKRVFTAFRKIFASKKKKEKHAKPFQVKNYKDSIQTGDESEGSSSSISSVCGESYELLVLPKSEEFAGMGKSALRKRNNGNLKPDNDRSQCVCLDPSKRHEKSASKQSKSLDYEKYCHKHFKTKELPRYMKSVCSNTKYFEINESSSCYSPQENIRVHAYFSQSTDTRSSVDSNPSRDRRSSTNDADDNESYIYTSENNIEKRYDSRGEISDSTLPEDMDFSEISTDFSFKKKKPVVNNDKNINRENLTEEDKINEDSDEKGLFRSAQLKPEKIKLYDPLAGLELYNMDDKPKVKRKPDNKKSKENHAEDTRKLLETTVTTNKKSDVLKRDKIDKETANAKKKNSLIQKKPNDLNNDNAVKKIDKSVGVREVDIESDEKRKAKKIDEKSPYGNERSKNTSTKRHVGGGEHYKCSSHKRLQERTDEQRFVPGFQPIIFERDDVPQDQRSEARMRFDNYDDISPTPCLGTHIRPNTRDQGTYVRLKTKKNVAESKTNADNIDNGN